MPMAAPPVPDWLRRSPVATPTSDANVHQGTQVQSAYGALHPETWGQMAPEALYGQGPSREGGVEAVPFGSLLDPVSQAAFLAAPGVQALARQVLPQAGMSAPRLPMSFLAQQRGNLGRPPMNATGEMLPESLVRDEAGNLQRLYHGTSTAYPDFAMSKSGSGAGGDLYGPGIYMTENPQIARDYATMGWGEHGQEALRDLEFAHTSQQYYVQRAADARTVPEAMDHMTAARTYDPLIAQANRRMQGYAERSPHLFEAPANIRPVYADLKQPFDMDAPLTAEGRDALLAAVKATPAFQDLRVGAQGNIQRLFRPDKSYPGSQIYNTLTTYLGSKEQATHVLQQAGYDGITHLGGAITGGQSHRVFIAFSPDSVYPSFNVDALRPPQ